MKLGNISQIIILTVLMILAVACGGSVEQQSGNQSLDEAVIKTIGEGDSAGLAAALEGGGDANAESTPGRPALYLATSRGNADAARLLIDHGADIHADTWEGAILVKAAREGHREIVEMLLNEGADIEAVGKAWDGGDGTALWAAAENAHGETVELLVERGADVNAVDVGGVSVLMIAAGNNLAEIVTLLLENGADIDHQADDGSTALHGAALHPFNRVSSPEAASVLIEHGAALNIEDAQGRTPLDIALPDVAELLREAGATE
jgi:uncharacterized protein